MPAAFYWLAAIHTLYILIFHSLVNFLPHYIYTAYDRSATDAGYIASIPYVVVSVLFGSGGCDRVSAWYLF